ncbi:MAG: tRNA (adenosine(37)-N6)-dimethylallyltransferase MiaA [Bacteroidetes bacterium]|nr:tRNA (adenosine(37)-N6)-dimethylallyltransferase MiaA [Bacteroidota bacterium]
MKPFVVVICGPTASGKTTAAVEVAEQLGTEIVSADSRQIYKELNIGVAKPGPEDLARVPHHFIGHVSIHTHYNAGEYTREATAVLANLLNTRGTAVVVGGTGLYLQSLLQGGLHELPNVPEEIRLQVASDLKNHGLDSLVQHLKQLDPQAAESIDIKNPARVLRALELLITTNKPLAELYAPVRLHPAFRSVWFAPDWPRNQLYKRIHARVDQMLEQGLEQEARELFPYRHLKALQTVGYNEWFPYFDGDYMREKAIELLQQHTRNYAKRQLTWFRNKTESEWIAPENMSHTIFARLKNHGYTS